MQWAPDCDLALVHDDDLAEIVELGHGRDAVSRHLICSRIVFILAVTGNQWARSDDGSPSEVRSKDT